MSDFTNIVFRKLYLELSQIITGDYIYIAVPHYSSNVGDVLLWKSTSDFLQKIKHKCLYECSIRTYEKPQISDNIIIVIHPGGNFGDIWRDQQEFRHRILTDFPNNPIVQLPNSVWFNDKGFMEQDIERFRNHKAPITICLRERQSYNIICQHYPFVKAILLPDMALSFEIEKYCRRHFIKRGKGVGTLLLQRNDVELKNTPLLTQLKNNNIFYSDWPCMDKPIIAEFIVKKVLYTSRRLGKPFQNRLTAFCYKRIMRPLYIRNGIKYINQYHTIYSTRLHAAIIASLLGKEVHLLDNSYGKCFSVYDTWMNDIPNVLKETT